MRDVPARSFVARLAWRPAAVWAAAGLVLMILVGTAILARRPPAAAPPIASRPTLSQPPPRPYVLFISLIPDATFKHVVLAPLASPDGARYVTALTCERAYFSGSHGLCLGGESDQAGGAARFAYVFDDQFKIQHKHMLNGPPSRTRLSPDGRRAAFTVFDEGHSYADGFFSTQTTLVDTIDGTVIGDLEQFRVMRDGEPFVNKDFNFWGVTFTKDSNRFFATLRTGGGTYLVEGDVDKRAATVLMPGAECPSLSPDNRRIVFKRQLGGTRGWWQLSLLNLAPPAAPSPQSVKVLASETRSVDDQVEWLDDSNLLYFYPTSDGNITWRLNVDSDERAQVFLPAGFSPSVVR